LFNEDVGNFIVEKQVICRPLCIIYRLANNEDKVHFIVLDTAVDNVSIRALTVCLMKM
jgi:hypothetical protein